ncbi:hypothetical protein V8E53_003208 [Lactarius tabidus]
MSKSRPSLSLSVGSWQPIIRDSKLLLESEDRMDAEASPEGENASGTDVPSSPEDKDQEDVDMELPEGKHSFGMDGSPSPQSQYSFSIESLSLPEEMDDFGPILPLSCQEPTLPKMDGVFGLTTQESGMTSLTAPWEDLQEDFSLPVEAEMLIENPLAAQEDVGMCVPLSTEVEGLGNSLAAHIWKWGECAPSPNKTDVPPSTEAEGLGNSSAAHNWMWGERAPSPNNTEIQESEGRVNLLEALSQEVAPQSSQLIAAAIYHAEFARLQCIHSQIRLIYEEGVCLTEVVEAMVEELDSAEVQNLI